MELFIELSLSNRILVGMRLLVCSNFVWPFLGVLKATELVSLLVFKGVMKLGDGYVFGAR